MKDKKFLVVDLNGTSTIYTHYLANSLKTELNDVCVLGKEKEDFLNVFDNVNKYIGFNIGLKLLDYLLNWFWLLVNFRKYDGIVIQWLQLLKYSSIEIYFIKFLQKRIPLIYIVHNVYPHNNTSLKVKNRYNRLYRECENIAVQTRDVKFTIKKINPMGKVFEIQHGLFFREFRNKEENFNSQKCLLIGYVSKYKGIEDAVKIANLLNERKVDFTLEIIGHGEPRYLKELEEKVGEYALNDKVKFFSKEVDTKFLIDKINEAAMLWLPYKNISQSGVAYTSVGLGIPFVCYNVGNFNDAFGGKGIMEIVEKDNLQEFSFSVEKILLNNKEYRRNILKTFPENLWSNNTVLIEKVFNKNR